MAPAAPWTAVCEWRNLHLLRSGGWGCGCGKRQRQPLGLVEDAMDPSLPQPIPVTLQAHHIPPPPCAPLKWASVAVAAPGRRRDWSRWRQHPPPALLSASPALPPCHSALCFSPISWGAVGSHSNTSYSDGGANRGAGRGGSQPRLPAARRLSAGLWHCRIPGGGRPAALDHV
jgi:hypothetical protein